MNVRRKSCGVLLVAPAAARRRARMSAIACPVIAAGLPPGARSRPALLMGANSAPAARPRTASQASVRATASAVR